MFFIRSFDSSSGVSKFYDKTSGTHNNGIFVSYPYKSVGFVSYDRAFSRMSTLKKQYPHLTFDILIMDVHR